MYPVCTFKVGFDVTANFCNYVVLLFVMLIFISGILFLNAGRFRNEKMQYSILT